MVLSFDHPARLRDDPFWDPLSELSKDANCSLIFSGEMWAALGSPEICQWSEDHYQMRVPLGYSATLLLNETVVINGTLVPAGNTAWPGPPLLMSEMYTLQDFEMTTVDLDSGHTIHPSNCSWLRFTCVNLTGHAGRPYRAEWSFGNSTPEAMRTSLQSILDKETSDDALELLVSPQRLNSAVEAVVAEMEVEVIRLELVVVITNWLSPTTADTASAWIELDQATQVVSVGLTELFNRLEARPPEPVVTGPRVVDFCSAMRLDASPSRFLATTAQPNVSWRVAAASCYQGGIPGPAGDCDAAALQGMEAEGALLRIAADQRPSKLKSVDMEALVTNRCGVSKTLVVQVTISHEPRPSVNVLVSPPHPNPFTALALRAIVKQSECQQTPLRYAWQLASVSTNSSQAENASLALEGRATERWQSSSGGAALGIGWNTTNLLFPPLALAAGVAYHFQLALSAEASQDVSAYVVVHAVSVNVDPSALQMIFRQPLVVMRRDQEVNLDLSPSFDPDRPEAVLPSPSWSCKPLEPEDACPTAITQALQSVPDCHEDPAAIACRPSPSALRVAANVLTAGSKLQLVAQVIADIVSDSDPWWRSPFLLLREGVVASEVVVEPEDAALTQLAAITAWIVTPKWQLGEHEPVRLEGFAVDEGSGSLQYTWVLERAVANPLWQADRAESEGAAYLVPRLIYSASAQALGSTSSLMLPAKTLVPGKYRFILNASDTDDPRRFAIGASEIQVARSEPYLGLLNVTPSQGISGVTEFSLDALGWSAEEDGLPLLYEFGYVDQTDTARGGLVEMRLSSGPAALILTKDLPPGEWSLFVDVYTTWGGSLRAYATVTVTPQPVTNATAERLAERLQQIELNDPADAVAQLPLLLAQFPESNLSSSILMTSLLGSWSRSRERSVSSSVAGLPSWPPPGLGLTLSGLMQSIRPLCRHFQGPDAQLECSKALRPLVAASFPSDAVIDQLRLMPERVPKPVLQPETRLASSLIRSLTDLAFMETDETAPSRRLEANASNESAIPEELGSSSEALAWIMESMANSHYSLVPHLTPGEVFEIVSPSMSFRSQRSERDENHSLHTETRPFLLHSESTSLNPSSWLFLSLSLSDTIGLPEGTVASENSTEDELPFVGFVAVSDSLGVPREASIEIYGSMYSREMPAASCFRWDARGWSRQGVVMQESGDCSLNLTLEGGARALVALLEDEQRSARVILEVEEEKLKPQEEAAQPVVLAAFSGIAGLLLLNVGLAGLSRMADVKVNVKIEAQAIPRDYMESPGYKMVRIVPDFLVYGTDAENGIHYVRSWLSACLTSHLFVGLYTADKKVPIQQKVATLITTCSCATGSASILAVRLGFSATASAFLGGIIAWPVALLVKALYEWRPWCPAEDLINEVVDASEQARIKELLSDDKEASSVRTDTLKSAYEVSSDEKEMSGESPKAKRIIRKSSAEAVDEAAAGGKAAAKAAKEVKEVPTVVLSATPGMRGLKLGAAAAKLDLKRLPAATPKLRPMKIPARTLEELEHDEGVEQGDLQRCGLVFGKIPDQLRSAKESKLWHHWDMEDELLSKRSRSGSPKAKPRLAWQAPALKAPEARLQSLSVASELLAQATRVAGSNELQVPTRPLPTPSRRSLAEAHQEVDDLLETFRQEPPPVAKEMWSQLAYEEQSVKHMQKQLQRTLAAHVRSLERPYVEEARQDLPDEVSHGMVLLAYLGTIGVLIAGGGCTMNYWTWIAPSQVGGYLVAIIGSMGVVSVLEMLRMVLVVLVALARLETRRRSSQAAWTRRHPEILEVKPRAPLSGTKAKRRWPGQPEALVEAPTPKGVWATRKLQMPWWQSAKPPLKGEKAKKAGWRRFLRRVAPEKERNPLGVVPESAAQAATGQISVDEVKRRLEEREAEQVAALMNMVPPWAAEGDAKQTAGAARVRRAEAWTESAAKTSSKRTKSSRVRFDMAEESHGIVPSAPARAT